MPVPCRAHVSPTQAHALSEVHSADPTEAHGCGWPLQSSPQKHFQLGSLGVPVVQSVSALQHLTGAAWVPGSSMSVMSVTDVHREPVTEPLHWYFAIRRLAEVHVYPSRRKHASSSNESASITPTTTSLCWLPAVSPDRPA